MIRGIKRTFGMLAFVVGVAAVAVSMAQTDSAATSPAGDSVGKVKWADAPEGARITEKGWFATPTREKRPTLPQKVTRAYVIPIRAGITPAMYDAIKRKVLLCKGAGAQMVIFDMNTLGGDSDSMGKIADLITDDLEDVFTVVYVNPQAISAGAIISLACDEIVMAPSAKIGDAMPILISPQGGLMEMSKEVRAKIESYARSSVRLLAERNGYNQSLCEAMITVSMEIWLIRNRDTGELKMVEPREWRTRVADVPGQAKPKEPAQDKSQKKWQYVQSIDQDDTLVTLTTREATFVGISARTFESMDELKAHYNITGEPKVLEDSAVEGVVRFLTSPQVAFLLMFVGMISIYTEMHSPGFGVAGIIAVLCFATLFGSRYLTGLAVNWEIALFMVGLILLAVEIFVIPGFGVAGVTGILCCVVSLLAIFIANAPDKLPLPKTDLDWGMLSNGVLSISLAFITSTILAVVLAKYLRRLPVANRLILAPVEAYEGSPASELSPITRVQVGDVGVLETPCRPVGEARFNGELIDAATEDEFLPTGTKVRVICNEGNRLIVEKV